MNLIAAYAYGQRLAVRKRRDRYQEAEFFYRTARARFEAENDEAQCVLIDTNLATALIFQHKFRDASLLYKAALARAEELGLGITQAVIECDLGCLALFQGRYDQALDFLERSRRRYAALGMLHESAIAEQEIADAYLELNPILRQQMGGDPRFIGFIDRMRLDVAAQRERARARGLLDLTGLLSPSR